MVTLLRPVSINGAFQRTKHIPLCIGSVKPNIGRLEAASNVASLMKAVAVLEKGLIPPNINFREAQCKNSTEECNIKVYEF